MKIYFLSLFLIISFFGSAQNNFILKTDDGRRVLLKADYTWEYIDADTSTDEITSPNPVLKDNTCNLGKGITEPKLNTKIQSQLKKGRATIKHVKAKVAKDHNCNIADVILLSVKEQKAKATYTFCANGTKVSYKRVGNSIIKKSDLF